MHQFHFFFFFKVSTRQQRLQILQNTIMTCSCDENMIYLIKPSWEHKCSRRWHLRVLPCMSLKCNLYQGISVMQCHTRDTTVNKRRTKKEMEKNVEFGSYTTRNMDAKLPLCVNYKIQMLDDFLRMPQITFDRATQVLLSHTIADFSLLNVPHYRGFVTQAPLPRKEMSSAGDNLQARKVVSMD